MQLLELLYEREFKKLTLFKRKLSLYEDKILLCGAKQSGKSFLVYDYLSNEAYGSYLYIDFSDFRVTGITKEKLEKFIEEKNITTLVLDNFDFSFTPPNVLKTIIISTKKEFLDGFRTKILFPLDFEEFMLFEKKFISEQISFNNFTLIGSYPFIAVGEKEEYEHRYRLLLKSLVSDEVEFFILKTLALKQATKVTKLGLFKEIKEQIKISKDRFYEVLDRFSDEFLISFVKKYEKNSHSHKVFVIDFATRGVLSYEKDFAKRLESIVYLEIFKRGEDVFYSDSFDLVVPNKEQAISITPFLPDGMLKTKLNLMIVHALRLGLKKITLITLEPSFSYTNAGVVCEAVPFWEFASRG